MLLCAILLAPTLPLSCPNESSPPHPNTGERSAINLSANLSTQQHPITEGMLDELRDSAEYVADTTGLQARMEEDGYLFLQGVLNITDVLAARHEIFQRLGAVGEIAEPFGDAISSRTSRGELVEDLGTFRQSMCEPPALRMVTHGGPIVKIMETYFGEPVRSYDILWLRAVPPGPASAFHSDTDGYHFTQAFMGPDGKVLLWGEALEAFPGPLAEPNIN